ncbi:hypothetical protein [Hyalangium sp.]|uniref:hypothetical protein n=1 Tax=Hyalangium sp. TaxID=2028555 RepID=UPI002D21FE78|nr:hypothetical protein [Hyalangium sp.]HYH99382.1 hypothetical protein [Hyalangium sp.]
MKLRETIEYARALFVELWVGLWKDHPRFQDQEGEVRRNEVVETTVQVRKLLDEGKKPPAEWNDLVRLSALDVFLAEHAGSGSTGVKTQISTPVRLGDGQLYHLYRRPQGMRQGRVEGKVGHLRNWTRHHWVISEALGGYQVEIRKPRDYLFEKLADMHAKGERLRVAICHFEDGVKLKLAKPHPPSWRAESLTDPETRWQTVRGFLEQARAARAHVLVLPELTATPAHRERVQQWLEEQSATHGMILVLPGSFHEADGANPDKVFNRAELLDVYGHPVLEHLKLLPFGEWGEHGAEDIHTGRRIHLMGLPMGMLAMPICLDFCEADGPVPGVWKDIGPEWVLVPAMGDASSRRAHARAATQLFTTRGSVTVLANQPKSEGAVAPGFVNHGQRPDATVWQGEPAPSFQVIEVDLRVDLAKGTEGE